MNATRHTPPALARRLAALGASREDREFVLADLAERFDRVAHDRGIRAARRWYWWQALRAVPLRLLPDVDLLHRRSWAGTWGDVRQTARVLARRPLYAFGVVGTLAIGLCSAAIVGSLAWHVWLSPMPFPEPDAVVRLYELEPPDAEAGPDATPTRWRLSPPLLEDLREHDWATVSAVSGVARNVADWSREGELRRLNAVAVSPDFFEIVGVSPLEGRLLLDDPDAAEVLLTEQSWTDVFGRDPGVISGTTMRLDGRDHAVVGVVRLPDVYPGEADIVVPLRWSPDQLETGMRGARYLDVIARVSPDYTVAEASAEMDRLVRAAGVEHPNNAGWGGEAVVLGDELLRPYKSILALLLAAGAAFLLLAVVNVAGLVSARSVEDRPERGIRLALGASESRLLRASVVESALLAGAATVGALFLAQWLLGPVRTVVPVEVPRVDRVALDATVVSAIAAAALIASVGIGGLAFLLGRGGGPVDARRQPGGTERLRGRNAIVVSQVALTTLLLTSGVAVLRTVTALQAVDLGFDPDNVSSSQVMLTGERYPSRTERLVAWRALLQEARGRGLDAAVGTSPPMAGVNMPWGYRVDPTAEQAFAQYHIVSPTYFSLMGIDVLEGRAFEDADNEDGTPVAIVNDVLAAQEFPGESAIGRTINVIGREKIIVGVVKGVRHFGPDRDVPTEIYVPFTQDPWPHAQIIMAGTPVAVRPALEAAADAVDPFLGLPPAEPYARFVSEWYAGLRLQLLIVGILAGVGLLLATLGLYALIAYRVTASRREIGVRMALGASGSRVFNRMLRHGLVVASLGLTLGLAGWYGLAPMVGDRLGEVRLDDPWIPLLVAVLVGLTSVLATGIPARRTVGLDPSVTLRQE